MILNNMLAFTVVAFRAPKKGDSLDTWDREAFLV